jgi:hypothetical protein
VDPFVSRLRSAILIQEAPESTRDFLVNRLGQAGRVRPMARVSLSPSSRRKLDWGHQPVRQRVSSYCFTSFKDQEPFCLGNYRLAEPVEGAAKQWNHLIPVILSSSEEPKRNIGNQSIPLHANGNH